MKELMNKMFQIMKHYDYSELLTIIGSTPEDFKEQLSELPLVESWGEKQTPKDVENQNNLISYHEQLLKLSDYVTEYCKEDSEANHYTYYIFKSKTSNEYFAFLCGYNSWGPARIDNGVYTVKAVPTIQYSIILEK